MSATLTVSPSPVPAYTQARPLASASASSAASTPAVAAQPSPAQVRSTVVQRCADSVIKTLTKIFEDELRVLKEENDKSGQLPEGATHYVLAFTTGFFLRPTRLIASHVRDTLGTDETTLAETSTKHNCYSQVLASCATKLNSEAHQSIGLFLGLCETEIQRDSDFTKSKILRSKVFTVIQSVPAQLLPLFR